METVNTTQALETSITTGQYRVVSAQGHSNSGAFRPWDRNVSVRDISLPGHFDPRTFLSLDVSAQVYFAPGTFLPRDISFLQDILCPVAFLSQELLAPTYSVNMF